MIYSKIIDATSVLDLQARLEIFLHAFCVQSNENKNIINILQSESFTSASGTHRGFESSASKWHGMITIIYQAKYKIDEEKV